MFAYILVLEPNWANAEDILQETAATAWEKFGSFRAGSDFRAWACRITHFKVLTYQRRNRTFGSADAQLLEELSIDVEERVAELEPRHLALAECLKKLSARNREILDLRYAAGGSAKQVADRIGISLIGAYKALQRIHESLQTCIEREPDARGADMSFASTSVSSCSRSWPSIWKGRPAHPNICGCGTCCPPTMRPAAITSIRFAWLPNFAGCWATGRSPARTIARRNRAAPLRTRRRRGAKTPNVISFLGVLGNLPTWILTPKVIGLTVASLLGSYFGVLALSVILTPALRRRRARRRRAARAFRFVRNSVAHGRPALAGQCAQFSDGRLPAKEYVLEAGFVEFVLDGGARLPSRARRVFSLAAPMRSRSTRGVWPPMCRRRRWVLRSSRRRRK